MNGRTFSWLEGAFYNSNTNHTHPTTEQDYNSDEASFNISTNDPLVIKKNILGSNVIFLATKIDEEWTNNIFNEFIYDIFIELVFNQIVVNES